MSEESRDENDPEGAMPHHHLWREEFATTAHAIERDFRLLMQILEHALEFAQTSDKELVEELSNMKAVAEHGSELNKMLLKLAKGNGA